MIFLVKAALRFNLDALPRLIESRTGSKKNESDPRCVCRVNILTPFEIILYDIDKLC